MIVRRCVRIVLDRVRQNCCKCYQMSPVLGPKIEQRPFSAQLETKKFTFNVMAKQMMSFNHGEPETDRILFHDFRQRLLGSFGDFVGLRAMWLLGGGLWVIANATILHVVGRVGVQWVAYYNSGYWVVPANKFKLNVECNHTNLSQYSCHHALNRQNFSLKVVLLKWQM